jgi:hypothetical protein
MRTTRACRATRREISEALADRQLADPVVEHVAACGSCREFRDQHIRLSELVGSLQPVTAPADFDVRLRARLANQSSPSTGWFTLSRFAFGTPAVAIAAGIVVLVGVAVLFNQLGAISRPSNSAEAVPGSVEPNWANQPIAPVVDGNQSGGFVDNAIPPKTSAVSQKYRVTLKQPTDSKPNSIAKRNGMESSDFSVEPAPMIKRNEGEQNTADISLSKPFEFSLQDSQGVTRKFSWPPVSFGSQQLVRRGQPYQSASYSGDRIW